MKFAINYSEPAEVLRQTTEIEIDLYKLPAWKELVRDVTSQYPGYVHFGFLAGRGQLENTDRNAVEDFLKTTETRFVNAHLAVTADAFAPDEPVTAEAVIEKASADIELLGQWFGAENIILENIPYPDPGWNDGLLPESVDPTVITEIIERTGCGLLLDVAHAVRACEGLGEPDIHGYIDALPVHALRELHVVGILPYEDENGVRQDHYPLLPPDWELVEWAVSRIRGGQWNTPYVMSFEYGGMGEMFEVRSDPVVMREQVPRLHQLASSISA